MKTLLFLLLVPGVCSAEDCVFCPGPPPAYLRQFEKQQRPSHYESAPDLTDWFMMHEANAAAQRGEEPIVIYHAKDPVDALFFRMTQDVTGTSMNQPKPKIIYEIGEHDGRH